MLRFIYTFFSILVFVLSVSTNSFGQAMEDENNIFLKQYWQRPIALQGTPPGEFSFLVQSLKPEDCGACHQTEYQDWKTSLHHKAMGPGFIGQAIKMIKKNVSELLLCQYCHAPLSEQQEFFKARNHPKQEKNEFFRAELQSQGVMCVTCHVRKHQRFGPPMKNKIKSISPHNGFKENVVFQDSSFCKSCHQFDENDPKLNGTLLMNTYQEWLESNYAKKGIQCQNCHMPDNRHLWRGIHDVDMVKKAIDVTLNITEIPQKIGDMFSVNLTLENIGAGHHFPTYITPKVFVRWNLVDKKGNIVSKAFQEDVIGREGTLNLSKELYDTRIPAGVQKFFAYSQEVFEEGLSVHVTLEVEPDHFYAKIYKTLLNTPASKESHQLIQQALENTEHSPFIVFEKRLIIKIEHATL